MTFLQPFAVWFLAGVPVIVLLYFLRLKRRTATVSTHLFWRRVLQESSQRAFFQRLRHLLSLLLHLLIFLLLIAALARPVLDRLVGEGTSTVLILDARARMNATGPDGRSRFAKALEEARNHARQASGQRQFALLTLDATASVAVPFSADEKPLLDKIEQLQPTHATGDIANAQRLADALLASRKGERRILVLSSHDGPLDNIAITRLAARPLPASPETSEVLLEVQNFGRNAAQTDVDISLDGRVLDVKPFTLAAGERRQEIFTSVPRAHRNARGWLTARLNTPDALALDDTAFATLPPSRASRVLLVSKGNVFLEKFLAVDPSMKFQLLSPDAWQPSLAPKFEAIIFDDTLPAGFQIGSDAGNFLFLKSTPFATAGAPLDQPLVSDVDTHPITRNVSLQNVSIARAEPLALPAPRDGWTFAAPLRAFDRPLLITAERNGQRIAALGFAVLDSDLPLRVAFPLLMSNTLHWLAGDAAEADPSLRSGEMLALTDAQRVSATPLTAIPRAKDTVPEPTITGTFQPLQNGYYEFAEGDRSRWLAVNTFSAAESDLRAAASTLTEGASPQGAARWPLWHWLAACAFALFTAEWWLFHRRKTE